MKIYLLHLFFLFFLMQDLCAQIKNPEFKSKLDSLYDHTVPLISVEEFLALEKKNLYILDTRDEEEFRVSHLKAARHVGNFWFDMRSIYDIPKTATIVLYCSVGVRSEKIAEKLLDSGYTNVFNLYGGIFEWFNSRQPVYKTNGVQTSEIHIYNEEWGHWLARGTKVK